MCPESKHSEITPNPLFNCCNQKNLFKMDPRVAKANVAEIQVDSKTYTANNGFTCLTTNAKGNVAVGASNGDIRLYTDIEKNAKCLYPGLGEEIIHLDSTKDGRWLLATTR
jgi:hypothetical protein